jgi:GTP cyclohydrolase I
MRAKKLREVLGQNAQKQMQEYTADKIWKKWENLFKELQQKKSNSKII